MYDGLAWRGQVGQHLARDRVDAGDPAVRIQTDHAIGFAAHTVAGPVQSHHQAVGLRQYQGVFNLAGRLRHQVLEFRPLNGIDAGKVQHANAGTVRTEHGCTCAAEHGGALKKVFTPVQPYRLQFGKRCANGRGAHVAFRQIGPNAGDGASARVRAVNLAAHIHHHALGVGENGEVACVHNGTPEFFENGFGGLHQ